MTRVSNLLVGRLDEYIRLIGVLSDCYDRGDEIVALSIATAIRVLIHDIHSSTSLLKHLALKGGEFLSTNLEEPKKKVHFGLVRRINVGVKDGRGGEAKYWPLCDERYFSSPARHFHRPHFDSWWEGEHVFKNDRHFLTRRDLVLAVTNKDCGAHFDGEVDERHDQFRKPSSGGSCLVGIRSGVERGYDNVPIYPAIRQIAYELLNSSINSQV
jgi:hypothetical protein